jgi:hypothetical protein
LVYGVASLPLGTPVELEIISSWRRMRGRGNTMMPRIPHRLWLLVLPFVGLLWVPFYNFRDPMLFGFPFFYWYQLAWVPVTALLTWIAYRTYSHED